jgi:hypothetical protein
MQRFGFAVKLSTISSPAKDTTLKITDLTHQYNLIQLYDFYYFCFSHQNFQFK